MSLYSAYYDSVTQKQRVLENPDDPIAVIHAFIATLKLDYLIYGKVVFTDAQIFDGAVIHLMMQESESYFNDFISFMLDTPQGTVVIKHGMGSIGERIEDRLTSPNFEWSSLIAYDDDVAQEVRETRAEAVQNGFFSDKPKNKFYQNLWTLKVKLKEQQSLVTRENLVPWDPQQNLLGYFLDQDKQYKAFQQAMTHFRAYDQLKPIVDDLLDEFNPHIKSQPFRSVWKIRLDNVINSTSGELKNNALMMQDYLFNCYVCLCAYQHGCYYSAVDNPFDLNRLDNATGNIEDHYQQTYQIGLGLHSSIFSDLGLKSLVKFSSFLREQKKVRKSRKLWLENFYGHDPIDHEILKDLFMNALSDSYERSDLKTKIVHYGGLVIPAAGALAGFLGGVTPRVVTALSYGVLIIQLMMTADRNNRVVNLREFTNEMDLILNMQADIYSNQMRMLK